MPERERYPELDAIKAVAIVIVVMAHALPPFWVLEAHPFGKLLSEVTRVAVPSFLAVSGFLYYQQEPVSIRLLRRRFRRVLLPYFFVSVAAYAYGLARPERLNADSFLEGLLLGSTFGPYYFVFVFAEMVCLTWFVSRIGRRALMWSFGIAWALLLWFTVSDWNARLGFQWTIRNPCLWAPWFLLGWVAAAHREAVLLLTDRHRAKILLACFVVIATWLALLFMGALAGKVQSVAGLPLIVGTVVSIFVLVRGWRRSPPLVLPLSNRTYAIYLLHPFFVYEMLHLLAPLRGSTSAPSILLAWGSGMLGAALTITLARAVLGSHSQDVIGA
jgi:fucose 4-O-acetylase-like acetyltransferase